jgi:hypothetical protein
MKPAPPVTKSFRMKKFEARFARRFRVGSSSGAPLLFGLLPQPLLSRMNRFGQTP